MVTAASEEVQMFGVIVARKPAWAQCQARLTMTIGAVMKGRKACHPGSILTPHIRKQRECVGHPPCRLAIGATENLVGGGGLFYAVAVHLGLAIGRQTGVANLVEQRAVADAQRPCRLLTVPMVGLQDL
jgi:hypothetical protein